LYNKKKAPKAISLKDGKMYRAVIKVSGEAVGIISRLTKVDLDNEIKDFKKACKELWPNEMVTIKYK
jgi:hypothetical protein